MLLSVAGVQIAVSHLCDTPTAHLATWHGVFHGIFGFESQGELMSYIVVSNSWTFSCEHLKHFRTTRHHIKRSSNGRFAGVKRGSIWFPLKMRSSLNLAIKPEESSQSIFFTHPYHTQHTQTYVTIMRFHPTLSISPTSNFCNLGAPWVCFKNIYI